MKAKEKIGFMYIYHFGLKVFLLWKLLSLLNNKNFDKEALLSLLSIYQDFSNVGVLKIFGVTRGLAKSHRKIGDARIDFFALRNSKLHIKNR